jgi:EmrB/QacA subfamily drug resistance transporter
VTAAAGSRLRPAAQFALLAGPLLSMVDSSIVNVAITDIARELHSGLGSVQWVVSGYLLALAAGLAASAYLAKRFGTRVVYTAGLAGFVAASAACAVAPDVPVLVALRAVQGAAGATLVPTAMSVLVGGEGARRIPVAAGLLFFLAPAIGPTLGGLLIAGGGWRWIFLINVPVGLLGLLGTRRIPPALVPPRQPDARFDPVGLLLLAGGLVLTLYGSSEGTASGWSRPAAAVPLVTGFVLLGGYVVWALRRPHPAVELVLLRHGQAALSVSLSMLSSVIAFGTLFLLPVYTQAIQGHSAFATGLALLPQGVLTGLGTVLGEKLLTRITLRTLVFAGFVLLAAASATLLLLQEGTPLWVTAVILSGRAVSIGFVVNPLLFGMLRPLRSTELADGTTLFTIVQRLGGSIGVGLLGSFLTARMPVAGPIAGFHDIGLLLTGLAVLAALASLGLSRIRQEP